MAITCRVGPLLSFDIVAYVRNKIEDVPGSIVPDSAFTSGGYIDAAVQEFARWEPLGEVVVGSFADSPPTSPLNTVKFQSRYLCNSANGFAYPVMEVVDVLYRASGVFTAASEIAYLALMPVSPLNWFRIDKDLLNSPTSRHIRDQYLQELDHYGIGYWGRARDVSGIQAIDIFPAPSVNGLPIFVRYTTYYQKSNPSDVNNPQYNTIPEDKKKHLANFLYAEILDQEADRIMKAETVRAGLIQRTGSAKELRAEAERIREDTQLALGSAVGVARVSW